MKKNQINKEALLDVANDIVFNEGSENLNIRAIAQRANVSVGSVYNYFPSKSAIVFALVEDFWKRVLEENLKEVPDNLNYASYVSSIYDVLYKYADQYQSLFISHYKTMSDEDKRTGLGIRDKQFRVFDQQFLKVLNQDETVKNEVWNDNYTPKDFNRFVMMNILTALRTKQNNISILVQTIENVLY
ncbi:MAG: TetR/AcrR family transcriptional regulator [Erysipelothrix sp.]